MAEPGLAAQAMTGAKAVGTKAAGGLGALAKQLPLYLLAWVGLDLWKQYQQQGAQERLMGKQIKLGREAKAESRRARGLLLKQTEQKVSQARAMQPLDALIQASLAGMMPGQAVQQQVQQQAAAPLGSTPMAYPPNYGNLPLSISGLFR